MFNASVPNCLMGVMQTNKRFTLKSIINNFMKYIIILEKITEANILLGVQLCFRRFSVDSCSSRWWSK